MYLATHFYGAILPPKQVSTYGQDCEMVIMYSSSMNYSNNKKKTDSTDLHGPPICYVLFDNMLLLIKY